MTEDNLENMTGLEFSAFQKDQSFTWTIGGRPDLTLTLLLLAGSRVSPRLQLLMEIWDLVFEVKPPNSQKFIIKMRIIFYTFSLSESDLVYVKKTGRHVDQIWSERATELSHHVMQERLPWWLSGKEGAFQCKRCGFDPCVRKIPWRRKWQERCCDGWMTVGKDSEIEMGPLVEEKVSDYKCHAGERGGVRHSLWICHLWTGHGSDIA